MERAKIIGVQAWFILSSLICLVVLLTAPAHGGADAGAPASAPAVASGEAVVSAAASEVGKLAADGGSDAGIDAGALDAGPATRAIAPGSGLPVSLLPKPYAIPSTIMLPGAKDADPAVEVPLSEVIAAIQQAKSSNSVAGWAIASSVICAFLLFLVRRFGNVLMDKQKVVYATVILGALSALAGEFALNPTPAGLIMIVLSGPGALAFVKVLRLFFPNFLRVAEK